MRARILGGPSLIGCSLPLCKELAFGEREVSPLSSRAIHIVLSVTLLFDLATSAAAQTAVLPGAPGSMVRGAAVGAAGGVVAKEAVRACTEHKLLCATILATGAATMAAAKARSDARARASAVEITEEEARQRCPSGGPIRLFRVAGTAETQITLGQRRYSTAPGRFEGKQFWLTIANADWFASTRDEFSRTVGKLTLLTSLVCANTRQLAYDFPDAGHPAISFDVFGLEKVNSDAVRLGGIKRVKTYED